MITVDPLFTITPRGAEAARYGNRWCHLEDSEGNLERLHAFAAKIGIPRRWFQIGARGTFPHYDLTPRYRIRAVQAGAVELTPEDNRRLTHQKAMTNRHFAQGDRRYGKKLDADGRVIGVFARPRRVAGTSSDQLRTGDQSDQGDPSAGGHDPTLRLPGF